MYYKHRPSPIITLLDECIAEHFTSDQKKFIKSNEYISVGNEEPTTLLKYE